MKITLIYVIGSALESVTYENVVKFKVRKNYLVFWWKRDGMVFRWKERLDTIRSFTVSGW